MSTLLTNLVSYWKLDEASGTRVDSHGTNDLTDNATVTAAAAIIGDGAVFDGTTEFLSRADNASLSITGAQSYSFWMKADDVADLDPVFSKWVETGSQRTHGFTFDGGVGKPRWLLSGNGSTFKDIIGATSIATGTWYHIVLTFEPSTRMEMFINGVSDVFSTSGIPASAFDSTAPFRIGNANPFGSANRFFDGMVDEFGVWNKVLSGSEITELYNGGAGLAYPFTTAKRGAILSFF